MDHAFELAFDLLAEAADRIQHQQYGITRNLLHNHGPIQLSTVHEYSPEQGHHLVLLATDDYGLLAAIEATAPDLDTTPATRIQKVRAGELTFHAMPGSWSYRAAGAHTYTLTAGIGDAPMWTLTVDDAPLALAYDDLHEAIDDLLAYEPAAA